MDKFAIIGVSCLFPGARNPAEFWNNLLEGRDSRTDGTQEIFRDSIVTNPSVGSEDKEEHSIYCTRGGFVRDFRFDASGFQLDSAYLQGLDDVFKWPLHAAREALQDSGYYGEGRAHTRTGVVMGNYAFPTPLSNRLHLPLWYSAIREGLARLGVEAGPYLERFAQPRQIFDVPYEHALIAGLPACVVGAALGMGGPRYAIDAACSSALYSLKLACDHLATGQADLMLAGAVCAADPLLIHLSFSDLQAYPKHGFSQPFDRRTEGILTGQGSGFFVLKRLADAQRDGDRIYAVVHGIGLSNDGAGRHLLSPNPKGQINAYELAYSGSGVDPREVAYIECHATGTPLGDTTEVGALEAFFGRFQARPLVGSVKGNIGHLLTVAGFSSMLKVILAMRHRTIPPTLGVGEPLRSPQGLVDRDNLVTEVRPWPADGRTKAAVSAFGFGGTNAHVILSAPEEATTVPEAPLRTPERLAIVGMGCHFGPHENLTSFKEAVLEGTRVSRPLPPQRWRGMEQASALREAFNLGEQRPEGGFIEGFAFNAVAAKTPPAELSHFNQQHLLMMKVANEALEDAGLRLERQGLPPRRVAVLVAMEIEPSIHGHRARFELEGLLRGQLQKEGKPLSPKMEAALQRIVRDSIHDHIQPNEVLSYIGNIMASRISSQWNFTGPCFTVSSDRNGGARVLEIASLMLMEPDIEAVVVGAVDLAGGAESSLLKRVAAAQIPGLFGSAVLGEGAGALVLTRPGEMARWSKHYATIDAIASCEARGPRERVFTSASAQEISETLGRAFSRAGASPGDVDLIETSLFEEVEGAAAAHADGLAQGFGSAAHARSILCGVSRTLGDTCNASLVAQVIKTALCIHEEHLPATPAWEGSAVPAWMERLRGPGFQLLSESAPWLRRSQKVPRRAVVESLSETGSYACLVLSREPRRIELRTTAWRQGHAPRFLPLSAPDFAALLESLRALRASLAENPERAPSPGLLGGPVRIVLMAADGAALLREVEQALKDLPQVEERGGAWTTPAGSYYTSRPLGPDAKVAFVYPGGFNSYLGLGRELFRALPGLLGHFEEQTEHPSEAFRDAQLYPRSQRPLNKRDLMQRETALLDDIPFMLATGTSFAMLYTDVLRGILGVQPHAAFGYSLGESSMMFALRGWDPAVRNDRKIRETPLFQDQLCGPRHLIRKKWGVEPSVPDSKVWASHVLLVDAERVEQALQGRERVYLTHINSPSEVVIAGAPEACKALITDLGCQSARSPANLVMHCDAVADQAGELAYLNLYATRPVEDVELISAVHYDRVTDFDSERVSRNIAHTLVRTVDFRRLVEVAYARGCRYFLEMGPGASCTRWVQETLKGHEHLALPVDRRGQPSASSFLRVAGQLICHGLELNLSALLQPDADSSVRSRHEVEIRCGGAEISTFIESAAVPVLRETQPHIAHTSSRPVMDSIPPVPKIAEVIEIFEPVRPRRAAAPVAAPVAVSIAAPVAVSIAAPVAAPVVPSMPVSQGTVPAHHEVQQLLAGICQQALVAHASMVEWQNQLQLMALDQVAALGAGASVPAPRLLVERTAHPVQPELQPVAHVAQPDSRPGARQPELATTVVASRPAKRDGIIWDEAELLEFATGSVAKVFGSAFAQVDGYGKRVRLPAPPYLFASRVTRLQAETGRYEPSSITTEFDLPQGAWFSLDGQVPPAVTIEAGQCDLLLISYLGIDFQNRGERVYRLLDSTLTFKGDLPMEGQTLRYDIKIKSFVRNGDQLLFFFGYECYADDRLILVLENACAGFFNQKELETSLGVVSSSKEKQELQQVERRYFKPLCHTSKTSLSQGELKALAQGRIADVFGAGYAQPGCNPSLRLPDTDLLMIDRVERIDRTGGPWGLGRLEAVKELVPDGWYFTCHFSDDPVLAGSMVAEGAVQLLQTYALFLGLQMCLPDARFQPIQELQTSVKVRGQITPGCREIRYVVDIKELDLLPRPKLVADVLVYRGNQPVISIKNLGLCVKEKPGTPYRPGMNGTVPHFLGRRNHSGQPALLSEFHMGHAAKGDLGIAMGPEFDIYQKRRAPYIPNGDFLFVDRVMELQGERGKLTPGSVMVTEYDCPSDAWYFRHNSVPAMPNCVLMETSLQAAILLGYYLGATLAHPDTEFSIRNLDGNAVWLRDVDLRDKTIRHKQTLLSTHAMGGSVLQNFSYELSTDGEPFYRGESLFGYFSAKALANQLGLDGGKHVEPWYKALAPAERPASSRLQLERPEQEIFDRAAHPQGLALSRDHLRLLDWVELVPGGGRHSLGYGIGYREIRPSDWYFQCHFYRDPVMPGSLGVEALIQAVQSFIIKEGLAKELGPARFALPKGIPMQWKYRGQILMDNKDMWIDFHVKEIRREPGRVTVICDGNLWKSNLRIYEVLNLAVAVVEAR